jgi:ABC-type multidrug transport system fused ATPase/permease subunit
MVMFPIFYLIQTLIVLIFSSWQTAIIYLISLPILGTFAWWYSFQYKELVMKWRLFFMKRGQNDQLMKLLKNQSDIISRTDEIIANFA